MLAQTLGREAEAYRGLHSSAMAHCVRARVYRVLQPPIERTRRWDLDLEQLCAALTETMSPDPCNRLTLYCEPIEIAAHQAWRASLIVSELVTNAAEHFAAEIVVGVRCTSGAVAVCVADSGNSPAARRSGSGVVHALARQLGGAVRCGLTEWGFTMALVFPADTKVQ